MGFTGPQTPRLTLLPFADEHAPALFAVQGDPTHMRFTRHAATMDDGLAWWRAHEAQRVVHGFAPWVWIERASGQVVGWGGLAVDPEDDAWGPEVLYFLHPQATGRGLAAEAVAAALEAGFGVHGLTEIKAFARAENRASVAVLQRAGFVHLGHEARLEREHFVVRSLQAS